MTITPDDQLNLAMCKWMGWKREYERQYSRSVWVSPSGSAYPFDEQLPNYLSDHSPRHLLNDAEARLTDDQKTEYRSRLFNDSECEAPVFANAKRRVINLLKVVEPSLFQ